MSWKHERRWTTVVRSAPRRLSEAELLALPVGSVRDFDLAGVRVRASKATAERWQVHSAGIDGQRLADLLSRDCERRTGSRS